MINQTILPFKLAATRDSITSHAGLALFGEFALGLKLKPLSHRHLPGPGSSVGYSPFTFVFPLLLMLNGGGRSIEDLRIISQDYGLRDILNIDEIPSTGMQSGTGFGGWAAAVDCKVWSGWTGALFAGRLRARRRRITH